MRDAFNAGKNPEIIPIKPSKIITEISTGTDKIGFGLPSISANCEWKFIWLAINIKNSVINIPITPPIIVTISASIK